MSFDEIIQCLSKEDQKVIVDMMALFDSIGRQTNDFSGQTGLKCKNGCGACCNNPDIETTVAEVLPLAVHLWASGQAQHKLEEMQSNAPKKVCVLYQPDSGDPSQGRCASYAYRPGLCRLFGFAARKDKYGKQALVTCKVIQDSQPSVYKRTQEDLHQGLEAPSLSTHAFAVTNIDPIHGKMSVPINQAIKEAVEKIGYNIQKIKQ